MNRRNGHGLLWFLSGLMVVLILATALLGPELGDDAKLAISSQTTPELGRQALEPSTVEGSIIPRDLERESLAIGSCSALLGTRRLQVVWSDGTPACGLPIRAVHRQGRATLRLVTTSDDGCVTLEGACGDYLATIGSMRSDVPVLIEADCESLQRITLPEGVHLELRVEDAAGAPVAGATIWSATEPWEYPLAVGKCDAGGHLELRGAKNHSSIYVTAPGFKPSPQSVINRSPGDRRELVFRLERGGAWVRGRIRSEDGEAVSGAEIRLFADVPRRSIASLPDGSPGFCLTRAMVMSEADGSFEVAAPHEGSCVLGIYASGFAAWEKEIDPRSASPLSLTLERQSLVRGRVLGPDGQPVAGAHLALWPPELSARLRVVRSDEDGRFLLDELPAGRRQLLASKRTIGKARITLDLEAQEEAEWEAILDPGLQVRGRVLDREGKAVVGLIVDPLRVGSRGRDRERTDERGEFACNNLSPGRYRVRLLNRDGDLVHAWDEFTLDKLSKDLDAVVDTVRSGAIVFTIQGIPPGRQPGAVWRTALVSSGGVQRVSRSLMNENSVRLEDVPAGRYCLVLNSVASSGLSGWESILACDFILAPGANLDLGKLRYAPPGYLTVKPGSTRGLKLRHHGFTVQGVGGVGVEKMPLAEGRYQLTWNGGSCEVTVASGSTTTLEF